MSPSTTYTACPKCAAINRIALDQSANRAPICGKCKTELVVHDGVTDVGNMGIEGLIAKSPLPVVVDFWAPWCGPCRAFAPTFKQAAKSMGEKLVFAKLDTEANPQVGQRYDIKGIPTLAVFFKGKELNRVSGALQYDDLIKWLSQALR